MIIHFLIQINFWKNDVINYTNFFTILHTGKIKIKRRSFFCVLFYIPLPFIFLDIFKTFIQIYYFFEHFTQWVSQITGLYLWLCTFNTLLTLKILFCFYMFRSIIIYRSRFSSSQRKRKKTENDIFWSRKNYEDRATSVYDRDSNVAKQSGARVCFEKNYRFNGLWFKRNNTKRHQLKASKGDIYIIINL